ncbi:proton-coupled amino acid transporter-like protein acs isoform X1 [Lycorma delicatula]|uniref:proton-coupled amino acid transporter-like protein acs isoform X1 n=1 Tax=Lycorma delicatula TaxID=130591 RepID=UPI003F515C0A
MASDYEPSEHRELKHPTNYCETMIHYLKASIGTGILAMPTAFEKSGYVLGIIGTIILGLLALYSVTILVNVQYELCRRYKVPSMTYVQTAENSFKEGPECAKRITFIGCLAQSLIILFQLGCCCIYLIFIADNVNSVQHYYTDFEIDKRLVMTLLLIPLITVALVDSLKRLAPFSFIADVITVISFAIIFYYLCQNIPGLDARSAFGKPASYPLFIGTVIFSIEAIGTVLPLENEMSDPKKFTSLFGVLNVSTVPIILLYIFIGLVGYLKFGKDVKDTVTLNLPFTWASSLCKILLSVAIFITYELCLFVAYDIIWKEYIQPQITDPQKAVYCWQFLLRVLLILLTLLCAVVIPHLAVFISLVGSLCLSTAGIAFPAIFNLFTYWNHYTNPMFALFTIWCFFIVIIGICTCFIGVWCSLYSVIMN